MTHITNNARNLALTLLLATLVFAPAMVSGQGSPRGGFPDLVTALKETPGCLGVETAQTSSGKQVIFAWFENKKAVMAWYNSPTHVGAMRMFFPGASSGRTPLADVPDNVPVLTIASLTMAPKASSDLPTLPVSQIAIELYTPLNGGLALGGRFAPESLKVPGLLSSPLTPPTK